MEGSPLLVDDDPEKDSETKKSKKKAKNIGLFLVESKPDKSPEEKEKTKQNKAELNPLADESAKPAEKVDSQPVPAAEAPLEAVGEAEKPAVERQIVEIIREMESEQAPDPDTDPAVEYFREKVIAGEDSETAYQEVITELGAEPADLSGLEEEQIAEPETAAAESDIEPDSDIFEEELVIDHAPEVAADEEPVAPVQPTPASGASGSPAPHRPLSVFGQGGPPTPGGFNPNLASPPPIAKTEKPDLPERRQAHPAAMALFGGVVGYLIGRRRSRIKTEKRLLPVQKKLEKQVEDMQWQLQIKEKQIRRVAAEKVKQDGPGIIEAIERKIVEKPALKPEEPLISPRRRAPEAHLLHGSPPRHEHIGQVLVAASETAPAKTPERSPETGQAEKQVDRQLTEQLQGRRVDTLNRAELLNLSEKIVVDGSSLRQIYETHLIGERGLRRLLTEHLRGGDIKKALQAEIVEREIDFERDPAMRDMALAGSGGADGTGKATLNKLIEKASQQVAGSEEAAFFRARANYEADQLEQRHKQRRLIDISLTAAIALLIAIVIFLIVRRG